MLGGIFDSKSIRSENSFKGRNDFVRNLDEIKAKQQMIDMNTKESQRKFSPSFVHQNANDIRKKRSNRSLVERDFGIEDSMICYPQAL